MVGSRNGSRPALANVADLVELLAESRRDRIDELFRRPDRPPLTSEPLAAVDDDGEQVGGTTGTTDRLAGATVPDPCDQLLWAERTPNYYWDRLAMFALGRGHAAIVRQLLERGVVHYHEYYDDHTLLAEAARKGHIEIARLLINAGADLHGVGEDGLTALAWASKEGQHEVVNCLRDAGAVR